MAFFSRLKTAIKELAFPRSGGSPVFTIYPTMQDWQHAITAALPGSPTQPSSDPAASSLVMSGIRWLATSLPDPPIAVMKPSEEDDGPIENHPLKKLLKRPNP